MKSIALSRGKWRHPHMDGCRAKTDWEYLTELAERALTSDRAHWDALWTALSPPVTAWTKKVSFFKDTGQGEDHCRDVLLETWEKLQRDDFRVLRQFFDSDKARALLQTGGTGVRADYFRAWLHIVVRRIALDHLRKIPEYIQRRKQRLVMIEVHCDLPGATVVIDQRRVATGPARQSHWLRPGAHQIIASKPGHVSATRTLVLRPGDAVRLELLPIPLELTDGTRHWAQWKPWAVLGIGLAAGATGVVLHWRSQVDARANNDAVARCSPTCIQSQISVHFDDRAMTLWRGAIAADVIGAAGVLAGLTMLYANRREPQNPVVRVSPLNAPATVGVGLSLDVSGRF